MMLARAGARISAPASQSMENGSDSLQSVCAILSFDEAPGAGSSAAAGAYLAIPRRQLFQQSMRSTSLQSPATHPRDTCLLQDGFWPNSRRSDNQGRPSPEQSF